MSTCPADFADRDAALVCVVDPDPVARRSVTALLHSLGADTAAYSTAREFLDGLSSRMPVCVVADARLPDMSGLALLQDLRARGLGIPTILVSDDADVVAAVTAIRAGARDFVEKPYVSRALATHVAPLLDRDVRRAH